MMLMMMMMMMMMMLLLLFNTDPGQAKSDSRTFVKHVLVTRTNSINSLSTVLQRITRSGIAFLFGLVLGLVGPEYFVYSSSTTTLKWLFNIWLGGRMIAYQHMVNKTWWSIQKLYMRLNHG